MTTTDLIRAALLADVREAAATFRRYEEHHRAKWTNESLEKAEVNAALAARLEATIDLALSAPPGAAQPVAVSSSCPVVSGEAGGHSSGQEAREPDAWLVEWTSGGVVWVHAHASELPAAVQAKAHGVEYVALYRTPPLGAHASQEATRPDTVALIAAVREAKP